MTENPLVKQAFQSVTAFVSGPQDYSEFDKTFTVVSSTIPAPHLVDPHETRQTEGAEPSEYPIWLTHFSSLKNPEKVPEGRQTTTNLGLGNLRVRDYHLSRVLHFPQDNLDTAAAGRLFHYLDNELPVGARVHIDGTNPTTIDVLRKAWDSLSRLAPKAAVGLCGRLRTRPPLIHTQGVPHSKRFANSQLPVSTTSGMDSRSNSNADRLQTSGDN